MEPHLLPGPGPGRGLAVLDHALLPPLHRPLHDAVPGHGRRGAALPPGHLRVRVGEENPHRAVAVRGVESRAGAGGGGAELQRVLLLRRVLVHPMRGGVDGDAGAGEEVLERHLAHGGLAGSAAAGPGALDVAPHLVHRLLGRVGGGGGREHGAQEVVEVHGPQRLAQLRLHLGEGEAVDGALPREGEREAAAGVVAVGVGRHCLNSHPGAPTCDHLTY